MKPIDCLWKFGVNLRWLISQTESDFDASKTVVSFSIDDKERDDETKRLVGEELLALVD